MPPCDHEEAEQECGPSTRCPREGSTTCLVRTVDTDFFLILIGKYHFLASKFHRLTSGSPSAVARTSFPNTINAICSTLGQREVHSATSVPQLHRVVIRFSFFGGKGKKSVWEAWGPYTEVTDAFNFIVEHPHAQITVDCQEFQMLERSQSLYMGKTSPLVSVNEARRENVLPEKQNDGEHSPNSTGPAQHTKRAVYQAGIWTTCHQAQQQTPTAEGCGWTLDAETKSWVPVLELAACGSKGCK
ncbi:hypothetical protein GWK47_024426 [Chionoecetes opilio]|uniref:Uncharacterized protein n=1 Tax=Chionoecetes opilio TaxID=41210 RepID=A0A8J4XPU3_CHIOP|nr:hypothetical protein GWK47_024426 [Chionoecetes opilio]